MTILITGGSGSGKSAYAEDIAVSLAAGADIRSLYYLATMQVYGEEGRKKVERHRILREGKGFETLEQPVNIEEVLKRMKGGPGIVLLECMSNLAANEMFSPDGVKTAGEVADSVCRGIFMLAEKTEYLIIVTNNVFEDGIGYETATKDYMEALGRINERLALLAQEVTEVVAGLPVKWKEPGQGGKGTDVSV